MADDWLVDEASTAHRERSVSMSEHTREAQGEIVPSPSHDEHIPGFRAHEEIMQALYEYAKLPVISTGFPKLDELLGGGFRATQPYSLAAGTGQGKTSLALQIAAQYPGPAIIWTLEMEDLHLQARMVAQSSGKPYVDILHGGMVQDEYRRYLATFPRVRFYSGKDSDGFGRAVERVAHEAQANGINSPILIVVDYLQKLAPSQESTRDAVARISEVLRRMAQSHRAVVLTVSAVSRDAARRIRAQRDLHPIELVDVGRETGAIEYDTAALLVLGLDPVDSDDRQTAVLTVAKNRFGHTGQVELQFHGERGYFDELGRLEPRAKRERRELRDEIHEVVMQAGSPLTKNEITTRVSRRKQTVNKEIDAMVRDGELKQVGSKYVLGQAPDDACEASEP